MHAKLTNISATIRKVTSIKDLSDEELLSIAASAGAEEGEGEGEGSELVQSRRRRHSPTAFLGPPDEDSAGPHQSPSLVVNPIPAFRRV